MSILIIDPSISGAAGDMLIAAILDLLDENQRNHFCSEFKYHLSKFDPEFSLEWKKVQISGFTGTQILTNADRKFKPDELNKILKDLSHTLIKSSIFREKALNALDYLVKAELSVHGKDESDIHFHFHELATIDTVLDIIGFYYSLEMLQEESTQFSILPIAVGGGSRTIAHGLVSIPAPATTVIIQKGNLLIHGGPLNEELLTPTGAAILASLEATQIPFIPEIIIQSIGRSFGTYKPKEGTQAFLRIIRGNTPNQLQKEKITILETNVDDVDGETIGYLFDILFTDELVLDFFVINTLMKKNRPGYLLQAIVEPSKAKKVTHILMQELGTLGVRMRPSFRHIIPRTHTSHEISENQERKSIRLKKGFIGEELVSEKFEYEDLKEIARSENQPLRKIRKRLQHEFERRKNTDA
ncbi:MAG: nickel pincer cofactor biosynthesis protein LarC [Candidatus Heimdallarchaeota archaeon]|nr:nickel pincer cofactor biosynthesis protein LarC [Candidatus Heimdallarchaeota archaeon]